MIRSVFRSPLGADAAGGGVAGYQLRSDLAQYCFPAASRDEGRGLAWVNSICFLFLAVGLAGLKQPDLTLAPPAPVDEIVPVIFEPPAQQEVVLPETPEEDVDSTAENIETPQVVTIVAADPSAASFAVPVQGPVAFAPARLAAPPPLNPPKPRAMPKGPVLFTQVGEASTPGPNRYPPEAQRRGEQGTVWVEFKVQTNGVPFEVVVTESSRSDALDKWAVDWIQSRWSFPPGEQRHFKVSFVFQLRK